MRSLHWILLIVGAIASLTETGIGQTTEQSWENLQQLRRGQNVQIVDMKLKSTEGEFQDFSNDTITVKRGTDEVVLRRADVSRVSTRGSRGRKALIGGSIGFAAGLVLGSIVDYIDDIDRTDSGSNSGKLGASAFGMAVGAGIGALLPGNRTIYRAKPPAKD